MDKADGDNIAQNTALQRGFGSIRDALGIDAVTKLEQTKDDNFDAGSKSTLVRNAFGTQAALIGFQLARKRRMSCTSPAHTPPHSLGGGVGAAK